MSEFHRTLLGLHAQARRIDRDQALLGALGVGAFAYPHQIDSVHRMVTGTACRWLLADEVGLGKTIQAIMVMRALAAQSPRPLTVALVVPDDLVSQWEEELLCRGHVLAFENGAEGDIVGNPVVRLVRPSRLLAGDHRITAEEIDLLLVDEFTKLQLEVRQRCIKAARVIPNVLVLTATPALHQTATRRELMALLEPEADRVAQAEDRDILGVLAEREAHALEHHWGDPQEAGRRRAVEETHGLYRRLIRTARTDDYRDALLPGRVYQPVRLAPTDGDVGRASSAHTYLAVARACNLDIRHNTLLQVAGRSPRSFRDRLSTLQRTSDSLQTAWQQIDGCLRDELGDAKLDALIDHLRELHARSPEARIVVVAEDNPTTDYLGDAIEKLTDVGVAKKRRSVAAAEDLEVQITLLNETLDAFISGKAKVLVAADAAREGHNLQFADEIIFFALPWSPPDIQQWIGRIDRLGKGIRANRHISITPLVVEGSIEDNILEVLEGTGVFLRSEVFDESEWEDINDAISAAATGLAGASWVNAARTAQMLGDAHDEWRGVTRLPPSPRTALALECQARFRNRPYAAPMVAPGENWYRARERAAEKMIRLAREDYLEVHDGRHDHQGFKTMWYRANLGRDDFIIPDLDARSAYYHQAFITRRSSIECPPRSHVVQNDGQDRRLHFFDHGGSLHDGAVAAFERHAPATDITTEFTVEYPTSHPILRWEGRRLLLAVCELDLRNALRVEVDAILGQNGPHASRAEQDARTEAARTVLTQFQADRRWMIDLCPPELLFTALVEDGEDMVVDADAVAAIYDGECARQIGRCRSPLSVARLKAARGTARAQIIKRGGDSLAQACTAIRNAVERRCFAAQADADNFANAARAEIEAADMLDSRFEFNLARQRGARLTLDLAEAAWTGRATRLRGLEGALGTGARLRNLKYFWVVPRSANQDNPQARR